MLVMFPSSSSKTWRSLSKICLSLSTLSCVVLVAVCHWIIYCMLCSEKFNLYVLCLRLKWEGNTVMRDHVLPDFSSIKKGFYKVGILSMGFWQICLWYRCANLAGKSLEESLLLGVLSSWDGHFSVFDFTSLTQVWKWYQGWHRGIFIWGQCCCLEHLQTQTKLQDPCSGARQGILGALPTRLAVLLIPQLHNTYKLYLVLFSVCVSRAHPRSLPSMQGTTSPCSDPC